MLEQFGVKIINASKWILVTFVIIFFNLKSFSQNYENIPVKEEYDIYNSYEINHDHHPCNISSNNDANVFGDGMSKILEGYVTMYKTTGDKAYLYKFVIQSLCMMDNRHDYSGDEETPRWSYTMYHDGYIIAAFSKFIYLIKIEDTSLFNTTLYQFGAIINNNFDATFSTFGQYAGWLQDRVGETIYWFLNNGYWDNSFGMKKSPDDDVPAEINMQIGFARAFLYNGLTASNQDFLDKANLYANLFKGNVYFYDRCEDEIYDFSVFRLNSNNAYWWYHNGWKVPQRNCWSSHFPYYHTKEPKHTAYTQYVEDISHGAVVSWLPYDFYFHQPNTSFNMDDLIRFRNTFAKNLYDNGEFHTGTDGSDNNTYIDDREDYTQEVIDGLRHLSSLSYMQYYLFDGVDETATEPDIYNIVMDFYINGLVNYLHSYGGQANKGHSEVVQAQWDKENYNLTLYNREVVYDQDFIAKNNLIIAPLDAEGNSYTDPIISEQKFIVKSGTTVMMTAGNCIELCSGFQTEQGATFIAQIDPTLKNNVSKKNNIIHQEKHVYYNTIKTNNPLLIEIENIFTAYPNPFKELVKLQFSINEKSTVTMQIKDLYGNLIFSILENKELEQGIYNIPCSGNEFHAGIYICFLTINSNRQNIKIVKLD
ncbi:MAG: T9SS type A sorting domain-containing protein [Bacteroidales bacterium]|nr:T9SS type A sorting domain-containing protein [Bacteroidales bacterium]